MKRPALTRLNLAVILFLVAFSVLFFYPITSWVRFTFLPTASGVFVRPSVQKTLDHEAAKFKEIFPFRPFLEDVTISPTRFKVDCHLAEAEKFHSEVVCSGAERIYMGEIAQDTNSIASNIKLANQLDVSLRKDGWRQDVEYDSTKMYRTFESPTDTYILIYRKNIGSTLCELGFWNEGRPNLDVHISCDHRIIFF